MVQINFGQREVSCKVVFYGPGMSGKTTNLEIIHKKAPKEAVGEMVSIATETDRTLYFDFLPLDLGQVAGMRTKFQLYTVPGQIYYNATRKLVLQGVDGVIFVADSNPDKMAENLESLQNLRDNLAEMNLTLEDLPLVLQYNKRDLPNALSVADMNAQMNPMGVPTHEACARDGKGVFNTLKEISRLVIEKLNKEHAPAANRRRTNTGSAIGAGVPLPAAIPAPVPPPTTPSPVRAGALLPPGAPMPRSGQTTPASGLPRVGAPIPASPQAARNPGQISGPRPVVPAQTTPARTVPPPPPPSPAAGANPRDRHLAKNKPPALDSRGNGSRIEPAPTDPNLKRYQEASTQAHQGGGALKVMLMVLVGLVILIIVLAVLVLFVPAVRAQLPKSIQAQFITQEPDAAVTIPAAAPAAAPARKPDTAPAPATPPATAPASTTPPAPAAPAGGMPNGQ